MPLLSIQDLRIAIQDQAVERQGWAVRGLDLSIEEGERLALVGESGCGKSMTALSILHLLPQPPMRMANGEIRFRSRDLGRLSGDEWRNIRGKEIAMVFQEPLTSLNPVMTVGEQVAEVLQNHEELGPVAVGEKVLAGLAEVGLPDPRRIASQYPHQLSGGMCQRVMIAMAIACGPSLLIADEPTTALDVTVQTQILELLFKMTSSHRMAVLFITHDLRIVRNHADRVAILYAGQVVEQGTPEQIFDHPQHPYTEGLLAALPRFANRGRELSSIPGSVPSPFETFGGCAFAGRCSRVQQRCRTQAPPLTEARKGHEARCFYPSGK